MINWLLRQVFRLWPGKRERQRSPEWAAVRAAHLRLHPTCAACGGREGLEAHHVYPFGWPDGELVELDMSNLITLCTARSRNCHLWLGHLGDWRSRNPFARADAAEWLERIKDRPYPPETKPEGEAS